MRSRTAALFGFILATFLLPISSFTAQGQPYAVARGPRVILFERPHFRGESIELTLGQSLENLSAVRFTSGARANDSVSSVYVEPGAVAIVHVDARFRGEFIRLTHSVENLVELARGNGWNWSDTISAVRVERALFEKRPDSGRRDPHREPRVLLFRHAEFGGEALEVFPGERLANLGKLRFDGGEHRSNDEISSIRVVGPVRVRVFTDANFRGHVLELEADAGDLVRLPLTGDGRGNWNDKISAVEVEWITRGRLDDRDRGRRR